MKKEIIKLLVYLVLFSPLAVEAQDTASFAKVYFIREPTPLPHEGLLQYALNYLKVYIDTTLVCSLNEQRFSIHYVPAGKHKIRVYPRSTNPKLYSHEKTMLAQAGKTYYVALDFRGYNAPTPVVIHPLTGNSALLDQPVSRTVEQQGH